MFITYIHSYLNSVTKTIHYVVNVTSTEAELLAIRYGINQATQLLNVNHIIVITDSIHTAHQIFDLSIYLYQY